MGGGGAVCARCLDVSALSAATAGCAPCAPDPASDGELRVVATTGIPPTCAQCCWRPRLRVTQMVPNGRDLHSWEPSCTIRDVAYADVAFSNYSCFRSTPSSAL